MWSKIYKGYIYAVLNKCVYRLATMLSMFWNDHRPRHYHKFHETWQCAINILYTYLFFIHKTRVHAGTEFVDWGILWGPVECAGICMILTWLDNFLIVLRSTIVKNRHKITLDNPNEVWKYQLTYLIRRICNYHNSEMIGFLKKIRFFIVLEFNTIHRNVSSACIYNISDK